MKKFALALAATLASTPAMAGVYLNAESNASYTGNDFTSRTTDLHIGYAGSTEDGKLSYYGQVGPGFVHTDSDDETETEISGKVGLTVAASDSVDIYGEIAGITGEDSSGDDIVDFSGKLGVTYNF